MAVEHVDGKNKGKVMLYALSTCGWCAKTKDSCGNSAWHLIMPMSTCLMERSRMKLWTQVEKFNPSGSFPTLVIDNKKCIVGFKEQEIREAFGA